ncbi:MAG: carbon-nitrogen hydrolase family protein [Pseudomonadota bacterium]
MSKVRVFSVQKSLSEPLGEAGFLDACAHYVRAAGEAGADFAVFPEHFAMQALASDGLERLGAEETVERLTAFAPRFRERFAELARAHQVNVIAGSIMRRVESGAVRNVAHVFLRDGSEVQQEKLQPTPDERSFWGMTGGDALDVIETDCGPVAVLICYDSEFPELARRVIDRGARILFVPYCTETRAGHLRVTYCCLARAIENQCYVVTSGCAGDLRGMENFDLNYAQSAVITPCDLPFARDGIAAEASENIEMTIRAELDLDLLDWARQDGAVRNLGDRRLDLYESVWKGRGA